MDKEFFDISEVAPKLGLPESTLRAWVLRRQIGYYKFGRRVKISKSEIDRLLRDAVRPRRE